MQAQFQQRLQELQQQQDSLQETQQQPAQTSAQQQQQQDSSLFRRLLRSAGFLQESKQAEISPAQKARQAAAARRAQALQELSPGPQPPAAPQGLYVYGSVGRCVGGWGCAAEAAHSSACGVACATPNVCSVGAVRQWRHTCAQRMPSACAMLSRTEPGVSVWGLSAAWCSWCALEPPSVLVACLTRAF